MFVCPHCKQNIEEDHESSCPLNHPKPNYYHWSWLDIALRNFIDQNEVVHVVEAKMPVGLFIQKYAKNELDEIVVVK